MAKRQTQFGFTLVELLVVISIIAVLLAVLMPAMSRARGQVGSVVCRSNQKQIVYGGSLWSVDHDGWSLPESWAEPKFLSYSPGTPNPGSLEPYVATSIKDKGNLFACPSAKGIKVNRFNGKDVVDNDMERSARVTYGINAWTARCTPVSTGCGPSKSPGDLPNDKYSCDGYYLSGNPYLREHGTTKLLNIRRPGETLFFTDLAYTIAGPGFLDPLGGGVTQAWHAKKGAVKKTGANTGIGYANIAWVDGHVSAQPKDYLDPAPPRGYARWCYYLWNH
jgi:prepilin-type N-terminal cleavage/methylation domain-containing protein/prepilin-type processing-associated H-X9-DG protein